MSHARSPRIAHARFIVWYFTKKFLKLTVEKVGNLSGFSHGAVVRGTDRIRLLRVSDATTRKELDEIERDIIKKMLIAKKN